MKSFVDLIQESTGDDKYRGYTISQDHNTKYVKNKESGHEWPEHTLLNTYTVHGPHVVKSPKFQSVEKAKKWIDEHIAFYEKFPPEKYKSKTNSKWDDK